MSILPPKLLKIQMLSQSPVGFWEGIATPDDPWIGYPVKWEVDLTVEPQFHGSNATPSLYSYDGNDIAVGDWIATNSGGTAVRVAEIIEATAGAVKLVLEDVDAYNMFTDPTSGGNSIGPTGSGYVFALAPDGTPVIPSATAFYMDVSFQTDLISRFAYLRKAPTGGGGNGDHIENTAATHGVYSQLEGHDNEIVIRSDESKLTVPQLENNWQLKAIGASINDDVDITLMPQNSGAVVIGQAGGGYIETAEGEDLTFRGSNIRLETHQDGEVIIGNPGDSLIRTDDDGSITLEATEIVLTPRTGTVRVTDSDAYLALLQSEGNNDAFVTKAFLDGFTGGSGGPAYNPISTYTDADGTAHRIMKIIIDGQLLAVFSRTAFLFDGKIDGLDFAALVPGVVRPGLNLNGPMAAGLHGVAYEAVKLEGLGKAAFLRQDLMQTGDLAVGNTGGNATNLSIGTNGQVLTVVGDAIVWADSAADATLSDRVSLLEDHSEAVDLSLLDVVKLSDFNNKGDLLVGSQEGELAVLTVGTTGQVLTVVDGTAAWTDPQGGESDRISTDDTSVETKQVDNTVTVNAGGRRVANFVTVAGAVDEQLTITHAAGKVQLIAAGVGRSDLEPSNPTGGRIKFLATGDASMRSGMGESFLVKPGDTTTGAGAVLTLAGGDTTGSGEAGGDVLIQPGSSGASGAQGQVKLPVGYTPVNMDSVVPKHYVDEISLSSVLAPTSNVSMNSRRLVSLASPEAPADATNKNYVDTRLSQLTTHVVVSGDTYVASGSDHVVLVAKASPSSTEIQLPETATVGRVYVIKDAAGDAGENSITITAGNSLLDGTVSYVLNIPYAGITALWNGTGWSML